MASGNLIETGQWARDWDGKGKATPSGARKWLVGFGFLAIRSHRANDGNGIFFKKFNDPIAIRHLGWPLCLIELLQSDNSSS